MVYKTTYGFSDTHDNQKDFPEKFANVDTGPYIGQVKFNVDPLRMGRLGVNIPALTKTNTPDIQDIIWCNYLSPFSGAKPFGSVSKSDPYKQNENQTSYGLWAVPPDIDTSVMVQFVKGERKIESAYWVGCVPEPVTNHMIPGMASNVNNSLDVGTIGEFESGSPEQIYGTKNVPVTERNRVLEDVTRTGTGLNKGSYKYPVNRDLADQLKKQGLIKDPIRGTTSSSATRESPSAVFGMSTPGRVKGDSRTHEIAPIGSVQVDRHHGHSFVMDDGDALGNNQLTRLKTSSGHQILMHDTEGTIYISHASGNAYIEMDKEGKVDIYSGVGGLNFRTEGDMNIHCDGNFNVHAKNTMRLVSEGELISSAKFLMNLGHNGIFNSSQEGRISSYGGSGISSYAKGSQLIGASGSVHAAGSTVQLNSIGSSPEWGPTWLTQEAATVKPRPEYDVDLTVKGSSGEIGILKPGTRKTLTTVHSFVHHEPRFRLSAFTADSGYWNDPEYMAKARTPGTKEFMEHRNRMSEIESIRLGQYQADALAYIQSKMGNSTDTDKAAELLKVFQNDYNKKFELSGNTIVKGIELIDPKKGQLIKEVVDVLRDEDIQLFANQIFKNSSGDVFTLKGSKVSKNLSQVPDAISGVSNDITSLANDISATTKNVYDTVDGVVDFESAGSIFDGVSTLTSTYSQVKAGRITNVTQAKNLVVGAGKAIEGMVPAVTKYAKQIGKYFGFG